IDLLLEVRDARIPFSSKNLQFDALLQEFNKKRFILFNKFDLCDQKKTYAAIQDLNRVGIPSVAMSAVFNENVSKIMKYVSEHVPVKYSTVGYYMMIAGCPNVGKSTIINKLRNRAANLSSANVTSTSPLPCHTR